MRNMRAKDFNLCEYSPRSEIMIVTTYSIEVLGLVECSH